MYCTVLLLWLCYCCCLCVGGAHAAAMLLQQLPAQCWLPIYAGKGLLLGYRVGRPCHCCGGSSKEAQGARVLPLGLGVGSEGHPHRRRGHSSREAQGTQGSSPWAWSPGPWALGREAQGAWVEPLGPCLPACLPGASAAELQMRRPLQHLAPQWQMISLPGTVPAW